ANLVARVDRGIADGCEIEQLGVAGERDLELVPGATQLLVLRLELRLVDLELVEQARRVERCPRRERGRSARFFHASPSLEIAPYAFQLIDVDTRCIPLCDVATRIDDRDPPCREPVILASGAPDPKGEVCALARL